MSIFDFLFARAATPEQAQKNIFLDAIDGGGRFGSGDDFRGGPLGISALLNALGVNPYGYSDAQPQAKPQGQSFAPRPPTGPARSLRPQLRPTPNLVDFIAANTGLRPSTDAELTSAFGQPVPPPAAPPIPAYLAGPKMGMLPVSQTDITLESFTNPIDETALNLLAPQVAQEVTAAQPVDYFSVATKYPEFFAFVKANKSSGLTYDELARKFLKIPEGPTQ